MNKEKSFNNTAKGCVAFNLQMKIWSTLNDIAIREYYSWLLLTKVNQSHQKTNILEIIAIPFTIAFSLITYLYSGQLSLSIPTVVIGYVVILTGVLVLIGTITQKCTKEYSKTFEREALLCIYLDYVTRFTGELKILLLTYDRSDTISLDSIKVTARQLKAYVKYANDKMSYLKNKKRYPECLEFFGIDDEWVQDALEKAEKCLDDIDTLLLTKPIN